VTDLVNQCGSHWVEYFGLALVQNTLFVGLILVALHLLRRALAHLRYSICLIGLIKLLLPPLIPASFLVRSTVHLQPLSSVTLTTPAGGVPAGPAVSHSTHLSLPGMLFLLWLGGMALYAVFGAVSSLRLRAALKSAAPIDGGTWIEEQHRDHVQIFKSDRIPMPLTFGVFPKRVYVPEAWDGWSDQCRRMVVSHELAHIRRWDGLVKVLQILAGAAYFFNPLVWQFNRQMSLYREMVCDDAVVVGNKDGVMEYSRYLVEIAERGMGKASALGSASALLKCRNGLLSRIRYQMREGTMHAVSRKRKGLILVGLFALVLPLSWYCGSADTKQDLSPASDTADLDKYKGMQTVDIVVTEDGQLKVDGRVTPLERIGQRLDEITRGSKERVIIRLISEDDVKMDVIREIQETLVELDLRKIVYEKDALRFGELTLTLPSEEDQERLKHLPEEHIAILEVRPTGEAFLDGESVSFWEIPEAVKERLSEDPNLIVVIRSFGTSVFDDFAVILALVKKGGATRISIDIRALSSES